ncbi:hypothetical protein D9M68_854320 [compost metagenome]
MNRDRLCRLPRPPIKKSAPSGAEVEFKGWVINAFVASRFQSKPVAETLFFDLLGSVGIEVFVEACPALLEVSRAALVRIYPAAPA